MFGEPGFLGHRLLIGSTPPPSHLFLVYYMFTRESLEKPEFATWFEAESNHFQLINAAIASEKPPRSLEGPRQGSRRPGPGVGVRWVWDSKVNNSPSRNYLSNTNSKEDPWRLMMFEFLFFLICTVSVFFHVSLCFYLSNKVKIFAWYCNIFAFQNHRSRPFPILEIGATNARILIQIHLGAVDPKPRCRRVPAVVFGMKIHVVPHLGL